MMEVVKDVNNGRKLLIAGACAVSISEIKAYIDNAKRLKCDACLICPPYYYPLKQDEVLAFYKEICAYAGDMRIIAYNVHFFTTEIGIDAFYERFFGELKKDFPRVRHSERSPSRFHSLFRDRRLFTSFPYCGNKRKYDCFCCNFPKHDKEYL